MVLISSRMLSAWLSLPKAVSSIPLFHLVLFFFSLSPLLALLSPSPRIPLNSLPAVIYYSSLQRFGGVTVWAGVDLGFAHLGMSSGEDGRRPSYFPGFIPELAEEGGGGQWGYR